ncbi:MAG: PIG-L deacetylase family protein [Maricaulaceae bacterium]
MIGLPLAAPGKRLRVLALGAHSDDIEIGAGGFILQLAERYALEATWVVAAAKGEREIEARASAADFLTDAASMRIETAEFADSYFPSDLPAIKDWLIGVRNEVEKPDLVLTHRADDAHQDHRAISELTWNLFRDHLILEYEIPKWDGDLGRPNVYAPLTETQMARKSALLESHFGTQRSKDWFDEETFRSLARLRGMECRAPERYAEGFTARKLTLG